MLVRHVNIFDVDHYDHNRIDDIHDANRYFNISITDFATGNLRHLITNQYHESSITDCQENHTFRDNVFDSFSIADVDHDNFVQSSI